MVKTHKILFSNQKANDLGSWYVSFGMLAIQIYRTSENGTPELWAIYIQNGASQ